MSTPKERREKRQVEAVRIIKKIDDRQRKRQEDAIKQLRIERVRLGLKP